VGHQLTYFKIFSARVGLHECSMKGLGCQPENATDPEVGVAGLITSRKVRCDSGSSPLRKFYFFFESACFFSQL